MLTERLPYDDSMSESWLKLCVMHMIRWSPIIGLRVTRLLLYLGLYLAGKQLSKLPTTILLLKHVLETLFVPWVHGKI